ncbi:hypothetical protein [Verrucomicrobium sp. BvORR106]|uniref:hypothetical protein n=1 Tax=Verrucomicrobium sp. BvORR106 TaxID=1403819 RepID=UPI000AB6524C|nr:hypothetical protein [Verrucomicrobium sp. BvORR106]
MAKNTLPDWSQRKMGEDYAHCNVSKKSCPASSRRKRRQQPGSKGHADTTSTGSAAGGNVPINPAEKPNG